MSIRKIFYKATTLLVISLMVASCSTYPSKFRCQDAKGVGCTMLAEIDRQIDSGKVEEAYKECKGPKCKSLDKADSLKLKVRDRARLYQDNLDDYLDDEDSIYF